MKQIINLVWPYGGFRGAKFQIESSDYGVKIFYDVNLTPFARYFAKVTMVEVY